jgi:hypothetical protein
MYWQVSSLPWADVGRHDRHSVYSTVKMQAEFEQVCGGVVYDSLVQGGEVKISYARKFERNVDPPSIWTASPNSGLGREDRWVGEISHTANLEDVM